MLNKVISFQMRKAEDWFGPDIVLQADEAVLIDSLGINGNHYILFVGAGNNHMPLVSCAIRGAKVDVVQPEFGYFGSQTGQLEHWIENEKKMMIVSLGEDLIKGRINVRKHVGTIETFKPNLKLYSHVFLLNVLDSNEGSDNFYQICDSVFSHLKPNSQIIVSAISDYAINIAEKISNYAKKLKIDNRMERVFIFKDLHSVYSINIRMG